MKDAQSESNIDKISQHSFYAPYTISLIINEETKTNSINFKP